MSIFRLLAHARRHRASSDRCAPAPQAVARAAGAIRRGEIDLAEWLLAEHGDAARSDPSCLNLLAVIAVSGGDWPRARSLWCRAIRIDPHHRSANNNLRRYFELITLGRSDLALSLGDEDEPVARPAEATP